MAVTAEGDGLDIEGLLAAIDPILVRASWLKRVPARPWHPERCRARVSLPLEIRCARPCLPDVSRYASPALASPLASVALR